MNRKNFRLLPCLVLALLANGCISTVKIDVDDSVEFSNFESSILIDDDTATRVRLRWSEVEGDDRQSLDPGERIVIGDTSIPGPAEVGTQLDLRYYSIAIGSDGAQNQNVRTSTYIGISQTRFDLALSDAGTRFTIEDDTTELYLQYGILARLNDSVDFGFTWALSLGRHFSGISEIDLKLDYRLAPHLTLTGGYRWFDYEYDRGDEDSTVTVDFRGPFIGLYLPF